MYPNAFLKWLKKVFFFFYSELMRMHCQQRHTRSQEPCLMLLIQSSQILLPLCLSIASRRNSQFHSLNLSISSTHKTKQSQKSADNFRSDGEKQLLARRRRFQQCTRWTRQTRVLTEQQRSPLLPNLLLPHLLPLCSIQTVCCSSVVPVGNFQVPFRDSHGH